ncbi:hypothetical protein [Streptomyces europaeiscabiei]|uniref:hypothetical protein n=1 Tax=Streptomyces europaeiscabiei TaxID=146819 RepID=UPI000ABF6E7E|nr:hypothetical protein [Streptomyces europaeiscabiei]MDX3672994.1 hypothetical protein [Streptomyces europaeiscabiei]MDX3715879.1 hypothetical protein [Streptomyces europaeiscabiei]MDX3833495.1 hypothetical protein [Streptomyces europaeiscabiei]MDX3866223.1 hypothetical protein [Streptomyces europaeiscabiei]
MPIAVFGARAQSKLIAPRVAEAPGEDTSTSPEESGAKVRRAASPITMFLYILVAMVMLLFVTAVVIAYVAFSNSSLSISLISVMTLIVGVIPVILKAVSYLRGDRG